ncbi:class I SAM-dependent methyltransferase [Candidatus Kaiserbacteria bacterium]|nr:class I SAM-dependent methyltransferase [Candidatus Kaiserbacteria bacterium]
MQQTAHRARPLKAEGFAHPRSNVAALGIKHGMRVADFGAGSGVYTLGVAEQLGGSGAVYAVDVQRDLLRRIHNEAVRLGYKNVEVIWADLEIPRASKLADSSIDLVLISNLLFQVPDKTPVLREARRIVKSVGRVAIIDWSGSFGGMGPIKEDVVEREAALKLCQKTGLALEREFNAGAHHYGLILRPVPIPPRS